MKFRKANYIVKPISHETAKSFVEKYHYAKSASLTSVFSFGLFQKDEVFFEQSVLGVGLWMPPTKNAAKTVFDDWRKVLTLSRLAIKPCVPTNAATFFLARSRKLIKKDKKYICLLTYADTYHNHSGMIYHADNWEYLGLTKPSEVWQTKDGEIKGRKRGGRNLTKNEMENLGFELKGKFPKHKFRYNL